MDMVNAMKVAPFYSVDPTAQSIYHESAECERGQKIPEKYRRSGKNRRHRCGRCRELLDGTP